MRHQQGVVIRSVGHAHFASQVVRELAVGAPEAGVSRANQKWAFLAGKVYIGTLHASLGTCLNVFWRGVLFGTHTGVINDE